MSDNLPETPSKPGVVLRAAREELSMTLEQAAHELHLRPSVVKAIEDDDFDAFSGDVFLKGYFRSYCRLVNLHDERMTQLLDQQLLARKLKLDEAQQKITKLAQAKKRKKLLITLSFFIGLLALVAFAYLTIATNNQSDSLKPHIEQSSVSATPDISIPVITEPAMNVSQALNPEDETLISVEQPPSALDASNSISEKAIEESSDKAQEALALDDSLPAEEALTKPDQAIDVIDTKHEINAKFSGPCWFKLTDGNGKVIVAALKNIDDEVNFSGNGPFHMIIGDASKINLSLNQELVNLSPYTSRNGRAELTLHPLKTENEG